MNGNVVSCYKVKKIILAKYFKHFSAATRWPCQSHLPI